MDAPSSSRNGLFSQSRQESTIAAPPIPTTALPPPGAIKETIAGILALPDTNGWDILSSEPEKGLYLIHYKPEADMVKYGDLRGVVVDIIAKTVVCRSFGYTPTATLDELTPLPDGRLVITDTVGGRHDVRMTDLRMKLGFEATVIRVFKHDGVVYHSSHRRLNSSNSRWGSSMTFMEMFWALNGPADNVLFDPRGRYSPYCHIFLMVHPDILIASKQDVGTGYLVYLGPKEMYCPNIAFEFGLPGHARDPDAALESWECPYKQTGANGEKPIGFDADPRPNAGWIDPVVRIPETTQILPSTITEPVLFTPFNLTLEEANKHLRYGFYDPIGGSPQDPAVGGSQIGGSSQDPRLGTGEFLMFYTVGAQGGAGVIDASVGAVGVGAVGLEAVSAPQISGFLKVQSTAYAWRSTLRDNNPNLLNRMYQLIDNSYLHEDIPAEYTDYLRKFPVLAPYSVEAIQNQIKQGPLVIWPQQTVSPSNSARTASRTSPQGPSRTAARTSPQGSSRPASRTSPQGSSRMTSQTTSRATSQATSHAASPDPQRDLANIRTKDERLYNIWQCFIMAVPLIRQFEVSKMYDHIVKSRSEIIEWLRGLNSSNDFSNEFVIPRARRIVELARSRAEQRQATGQNISRNGRQLNIEQMTNDNIRNLISKEEGASLYRLMTALHGYKASQTISQ